MSEKIDGHNVRAELHKGSFKLGSRRRLIGEGDGDLVFAAGAAAFMERHSEALGKALHDAGLRRAAVFGELYGSATHMKRLDYGVEMAWSFFDVFDVSRRVFLEPKAAMALLEGCVPVPDYTVQTVDRVLVNAIRADDTENREGVVIKPRRIRKPSLVLPYAKAKTAWFMRTVNEA